MDGKYLDKNKKNYLKINLYYNNNNNNNANYK